MFHDLMRGAKFRFFLTCCLHGCQADNPPPITKPVSEATSDRKTVAEKGSLVGATELEVKNSSTKVSPAETVTSSQIERAEVQYRPDDRRPKHNESKLEEAGIKLYESRRLKLFTDIPAAEVEGLPELVDRLYDELANYFGPLQPDRAHTEFQMTGYLIRDLERFRRMGLLPEEFTFEHGVQRRNEFWVRDQEFDYYRRHLVLHEATHCFMNYTPEVDAPIWYLEGMAEYFAAHRIVDSSPRFRSMPTSSLEFEGFGRLAIIRRDVAANKTPTISSVISQEATSFTNADPYAWSWALCAFLDGTPRYHERFKRLGTATQGSRFETEFLASFPLNDRDLSTEWQLFLVNMQYGYDLARAAIDFQPGQQLNPDQPEMSVPISADRGWQSSHVLFEAGKYYEVRGEGSFTLKSAVGDAKAWVSEPQGISFRYFDGRPIGMLIGSMRTEEGPAGGVEESMLKTITLGNRQAFRAPVSGTLYLRLNDAWNSLSDNRGEVLVNIREVPSPEIPESSP